MNKKLLMSLGGGLIALMLLGGLGAYVAYAQAPTPAAPQGAFPGGPRGPHMLGPAELQAAAQALGMTTDDLSAQLKSGKTLADLAAEKGVDLQKVKDAIQAARSAELRTQINQAVTDGKMSQDKANWLLEGLDKGYLDGPGFGFGLGFGPHGPRPDQAPPAQPTQSSGG